MHLEAGNDNRQRWMPPGSPDAGLPDWLPDIERLKRETQLARESGRPDPWSLAEAECWRDLVEAEIAAQTHRGASRDVMQVLRIWKAELGAITRTLGALNSMPRSHASEKQQENLAA